MEYLQLQQKNEDINFYKYNLNEIWDFMKTELFGIFWILTVDNIYVPKDKYNKEIALLEQDVAAVDK